MWSHEKERQGKYLDLIERKRQEYGDNVYKKGLHNFYPLPDTIKIIKPR
jgi:hypothetical protein